MAKLNSRNGKTFTKVASYRVESESLNEGMGEDTHYYFKFALRSDRKVLRAIASKHTGYSSSWTNGGSYSIIGSLKEGVNFEEYLTKKYGAENVKKIDR